MSNPFPSWAHRDLETVIKWLLDASEQLADVENEIDLAKFVREKVSDARTSVKAALMLAREVRSAQEDLVSSNGTERQNAPAQNAQTQSERPSPPGHRTHRRNRKDQARLD
jgi:hypothetical protein